MPRLLSVILTWVSIVSVCASAESASRTALQRDYGVKLCGREFIRAVIFTCGGSRWKRSLDLDLVHSGETDPLRSYPSLSDRRAFPFSSSLGKLLQDAGGVRDTSEEAPRGRQRWGAPRTLLPPRPQAGERVTTPDHNQPSPDRRKRNFSLGLAGMCCTQGCTKNDIGRLC
ncbi:prorelaxin H1 [Electrophorus electricus]|uniref:prorelaxin H1 n=1 Tax=Electrophorus electricus TaxID=8005 RepID=UPI0015D01AE5|nr:prorelaxin H1 [Electrophorus electricus]